MTDKLVVRYQGQPTGVLTDEAEVLPRLGDLQA
jgi:hypothetical protein